MNERSLDPITVLGRTNWRNEGKLFGIRPDDRLRHLLLIGATGTGKSTLIRSMARQESGGFALIDPHGDLCHQVRADLARIGRGDVVLFDATDREQPPRFNPLGSVTPDKRPLVAAGILETFKRLWPDSWGPRTEHILRNCLFALLDQPEATFADLLRLLDDKTYRKSAVDRVGNAQVRRFWLKEFEGYPVRLRTDAISPVQNKVSAFLSDPILNRILTSPPKDSLDLRRVMDEGQVLLVNLAKGKLGSDSTSLLGSLLLSQLGLAALSRADVPERSRRPFFVYADEVQSFATLALADQLAEARKYGLGYTLSMQYLDQMDERIRASMLANIGSTIAFRVGPNDAEVLAERYWPEFRTADLVGLPNFEMYVRLMVGGTVSRPFSARALRPHAD